MDNKIKLKLAVKGKNIFDEYDIINNENIPKNPKYPKFTMSFLKNNI
jgi:hypothetical protein